MKLTKSQGIVVVTKVSVWVRREEGKKSRESGGLKLYTEMRGIQVDCLLEIVDGSIMGQGLTGSTRACWWVGGDLHGDGRTGIWTGNSGVLKP